MGYQYQYPFTRITSIHGSTTGAGPVQTCLNSGEHIDGVGVYYNRDSPNSALFSMTLVTSRNRHLDIGAQQTGTYSYTEAGPGQQLAYFSGYASAFYHYGIIVNYC